MIGVMKRVLIVEDDESVRLMLHRALAAKYEVESIADGSTALQRVQQAPAADLMLCDIMLPGADGLAVARQAKKSGPWKQVPIIFLTARTTPRDVIQGIQAGARHYVTKPFKLDDLLNKVTKVLE